MVPTYLTHQSHTQLTPYSCMNPKLSGNSQLHWLFNCNTMPLALHGTQSIINEKTTVRGTWSSHGVKEWYLIPSMNHYRFHRLYVTKTRLEWDSDCVNFFSHNTPLPYNSSSENFIITAHELAHALKKPAPQAPFSNKGDSQMVSIEKLSQIFSKVADNFQKRADPPRQQTVKNSPLYLRKCVHIWPNFFPH